jgi:hypothetical protein
MATLLKTRTTVTNDSGGGIDGTIGDAAWVTNLENEIDDFGASLARHVCQGRITLTTALPVTTADVLAATTIRYALYAGNHIALYTGSKWAVYTFAELSLALGSDTADNNYDLFAYNSGGTVTLERLAWTNDSTRATALTTQDGVLVKTGDTTRRYLGTYRTTGVAGQTEDSLAKRFVWNYYHRVPRVLQRNETTATWTYTTATIRQANASALNQVELVIGVAEGAVRLHLTQTIANTNTGVAVVSGIGDNVTTVMITTSNYQFATTAIANGAIGLHSDLYKVPAIGYNRYTWLEYSAATGTTTWYGVVAGSVQSGLSGVIHG